MRPGPALVRAAVLVIAAASAVAVAAVGGVVDLSAASAPMSRAVRHATTSIELTCPGAPLTGTAGVPDVRAPVSVRAVAPPPAVVDALVATTATSGRLDLLTSADGDPVATATARSAEADSLTAARPVSVRGRGSLAAGVVAAQEWLADDAQTRGVATSGCQTPVSEAWLLGGGAQSGRQERLVLTNTGANPVTVDVAVLAARGRLEPSAGQGIVVPAFGRTSVLVDAIGGTQAAGAVHVSARGGLVTATLVDRWLDGTTPAGIETVGAVAGPATRQVVPVASLASARLRVVATGEATAVVRTRLLTPQGRRALPEGVLTVRPGSVGEVEIPASAAGALGVEVVADQPVLAGVEVTRRSPGAPGDYAWATAVPAVGGLAGAAFTTLPREATRTLTLVGDAERDVRMEVITASGSRSSADVVTLERGTTRNLALRGADAVWLRPRGAGEVHAAVTTTTGADAQQMVAVSPVRPTRVADRTGEVVEVGG